MALQSDRLALGVIAAIFLVATLLYSVLILRAPVQWLASLLPLAFLYLFWRFVRAHERMAEALAAEAE